MARTCAELPDSLEEILVKNFSPGGVGRLHLAAHFDLPPVRNVPTHTLEASGSIIQEHDDGHQAQFCPAVHAPQDWYALP